MNDLSNGGADVWMSGPQRASGSDSIVSAFDRVAAATPDAVALEIGIADGGGDAGGAPVAMTYRALAERSAGLALRLAKAGIGAGDRVGLLTGRDFDVAIGMLGILRAGAAYVPLDPSSPKARTEQLVADAGLRAVALGGGPRGPALPAELPAVRIEGSAPVVAGPGISGEAPACVIYTSGSTGRPKGVVTPHRAVLRLVRDADYVRLGPDRRVLQLAPVAFDAATFEIWGPLLNGGTCVIHPEAGLPDPARLRAVLADMRITTLWLTGGLFNALVDTDPAILSGVEDLIVGGEALSVRHVRKALAAIPARIVNGYGPTETTTFACTWPIPRDLPADTASIPIGRPIGDTAISIRDEEGAPVAAGEEGELYIAGAGLALGYHDRPELTAEKFVAMRGAPGGRAYRTGDIVRMRDDGALEFVGRRDGQVKVAGHRIELGEIEAVFRGHPGLRDAAAGLFRHGEGPDRIALWTVAAEAGAPPAEADLAAFAAARLAPCMRPAAYRRLDALPLTASGKLDRSRLEVARLERPALAQPFEAPRGATEGWIAATWVDLIGIDRVGRHDRFFELGGTSLMVMRFLDLLHRDRGVRVGVADFFDAPTVEALARRAEGPTDAAPQPARPVQREPSEGRIAIVGMAGRFAGAPDIDAFWDMLREGRSGRVEVTAGDMIAAGEDPALLAEPDFVAAAYPLDEAEGFDAAFFGLTPREVQLMDPQQRIFLEASWSALEDAGCDPRGTGGRIGVFGGVGRNAYLLHNLMSHPDLRANAAGYDMLIGNERDFPCTHVAFRLGLRGPAVTVQTGCSTSGVAIHMAAESLRRMECDMALAGGAKVLVPNRVGYRHIEGGPLSPDGFIRAFDAGAGGMVRGSGVAMVVLKRLDDALRDGDHVRAVLIGSAINNDGDRRAGFTAPGVSGQAEVIAEAHRRAGIEAGSVSLIEAHGTGTALGDPIEVAALTRAFGQARPAAACAIGSVKTNIGHLDAGATAAGLIKAVLALEHGRIPPSLNFVAPNPGLGLEDSPFRVNDRLADWPRGAVPRRAGISSFGLGGTNAHLVIEEAPRIGEDREAVAGPHLFVLSARTEAALARRCADLARWLERHEEAAMADVAHSLRAGRRRFERRLAFLAQDRAEAIARLRAHPGRPGDMLRRTVAADSAPVHFAFPGTGTQYRGMARGLYASEPVFRAALDECSALYEAREGASLLDAIFGGDGDPDRTSRAMPAIFAVEVALGRLLDAWGVTPGGMIGHSLGEYSAACLAGVFSLEDAMAAVHRRATLLETLPEGAMLGVPLAEADLRRRLGPDLDIAAVNAPDRCVVSGPPGAIAALAGALEAEGIASRRLETRVALHSAMVEPILAEFRDFVATLRLNAPARPFVSGVTGAWITPGEATDPDYWARHLREPVRFADGLDVLLAQAEGVFLEVGPGRTLGTFARRHPARGSGLEVLACLHPAKGAADDRETLLGTVGRLWLAGAALDAAGLVAGRDVRRVPLPTYPFERVRHWIDPIPSGAPAGTAREVAAAEARRVDAVPEVAEEVASAEPRSRVEQILDALRAILHDLSGIPPAELDAHATFLELGFNSLFLTQANAAIRKVFGIRLTARQLLETTPGLQRLAEHLDAVLGPDLPAAVAAGTGPARPAPPAPGAAQVAASPGIAEVVRKGAGDLDPEQRNHIDALIAETNRRTPGAKRRTQESRAVLADPRTVQGFRSQWKEMVYPILSERAKGSKVWDVDGNAYVDLVGGYGVTLLGHQPDFLVEALREQIDRTLAIGPQTVLAGEVARLVHEMTGMERVAFCNTGSEAVLAAVRMARTVTGRSRIVKFEGHYHGIFDEMQVRGSGAGECRVTLPSAPGIPAEAVRNTIVLEYGSEEVFEALRAQAGEIACVLVEPIRSRNPDYQPVAYLRKLRAVTEELGIPLLIDEIVTGFRSHPGGIQALYGIRADLVTYGKVVGSGLPIGIVTGSARYMDALDGGMWSFGDESVPPADMTWFAGTFVRHPLSLAAARATLEHLRAEGPALQAGLNARSAALARRLNASFEALSVPIRVEHFASVLMVTFTRHQDYASLLFFHLRNRGVMSYEGRPIFLSTAHDDADLDLVHDAFVESARALVSVGLLDGRDPGGRRRIPMSIGQQEVWIFAQFDPQANCSYNLCSTLRLRGALDADALEAALRDLCDRHEALRALPERDGLMQVVHARIDIGIDRQEASGPGGAALDADGIAEVIARIGREEVTTPFDLDRGPLIRARLVRFGARDHLMLLTVHHVIADGWSCGILLRELGALYAARRAGMPADLPPAQQLGDFVAMQRDASQGDLRQAARDYWVGLYPEGPTRIDFPADRPRPKTRNYAARRFEIALERPFVDGLRRLATDSGTTLFATLVGGFAAYLSRLTGLRESTIGFSAAGQPLLGGTSLVGHCVSFLPLRLTSDLDEGFSRHLRGIGASVLDALEHQNFDFVSFLQETSPKRDADWAPPVSIGVNLDPSAKGIGFGDLDVATGSVGRAYENLDLFVNFAETGPDMELQCTFNTALFDTDTIERRMREYLRLLAGGMAEPEAPMGALDIVAPEHLARIPAAMPAGRYDREAGLVGYFRDIAARRGEATALQVVHPAAGAAISYAELDRRSDAMAEALRRRGVAAGDRVAVLLPRSVELVAALLGILKAGAVYVPVDVSTPRERVRTILADCGAGLVLVSRPAEAEGLGAADVLPVGEVPPRPEAPFPAVATGGGSPAYIMYTSGSTGMPKGVVVAHRGIARLVVDADYVRLDATRTVPFLSPPAFDASTFEIWGALLNGGRLAILEGVGVPELEALRRALRGATTMWLTSALFNAIVDQDPTVLDGLDDLLVGGQALSVRHVRRAQAALPGLRISNGYGPTENTTFTCCHRIADGLAADAASVPIGRPVAGTSVAIVDPAGRVLPRGVPGELVTGGDGLALGYWNRADQNAASFRDEPGDGAEPGARRYHTGDICRMADDGTVEFLHRRDAQVKIRGFRIEPGEVEVALEALPDVRSAAVIAAGPAEDARLVAFVVAADGRMTAASVLARLRDVLPRHMIPSGVTLLDALPVTANGKVDHKALARQAAVPAGRVRDVPPATPTERRLVKLWSEILRVPVASVEHDFFDLGGHSLNALRLFDSIARDFGADLPMSSLFAHPTIRALGEAIDGRGADPALFDPALFDPDAPWDNSVVLHPGPGGAARPVFIAGGVGGNVNNLSDMGARLGRHRPVIAFQARGVLGHRPLGTIEEIAAENIYYMRRHQIVGPYSLAGYSAGAFAAFEMARQLTAAGHAVRELIILDTDAPGFRDAVQLDALKADYMATNLRGRLAREIREFRENGGRQFGRRAQGFAIRALARSRLVHRLVRGNPWFLSSERALHAWYNEVHAHARDAPAATRSGNFQRSLQTTEAWFEAAESYAGGPYSGTASLVLSAPTGLWEKVLAERYPDLGWHRFFDPARLHVHRTSADHIGMVQGADGAALADFIVSRLGDGTR